MKKKILIAVAVLAVLLMAGIFLYRFHQTEQVRWLENSRIAYEQFHSTQTMYYTCDRYHASAFKRPTLSELSLLSSNHCWLDGRDFYSYHESTNGRDSYSLRLGNDKYRSEWNLFKPEGWIPATEVYEGVAFRHESWEEFLENKQVSVHYTTEGTKVRFYEDLGSDNCTMSKQTIEYHFCFDKEDKLLRVEENFVTYKGPEFVPGTEHSIDFSFHKIRSTNEEEIRAKIQEAFEEAKR